MRFIVALILLLTFPALARGQNQESPEVPFILPVNENTLIELLQMVGGQRYSLESVIRPEIRGKIDGVRITFTPTDDEYAQEINAVTLQYVNDLKEIIARRDGVRTDTLGSASQRPTIETPQDSQFQAQYPRNVASQDTGFQGTPSNNPNFSNMPQRRDVPQNQSNPMLDNRSTFPANRTDQISELSPIKANSQDQQYSTTGGFSGIQNVQPSTDQYSFTNRNINSQPRFASSDLSNNYAPNQGFERPTPSNSNGMLTAPHQPARQTEALQTTP
ncbi:MAG: hypothetical protein R3C03_00255 [Pirellulaceae bacterium]